MQIPSLGHNGPMSRQPSGQLKQSTPELRARLHVTNNHKKKESPNLQACPVALIVMRKGLRSVSWDNRKIVVAAFSVLP